MRKAELKFQGHIIKSYKFYGGYAAKWATELTVGKPDLVATLPRQSVHLAEVKHRPEWSVGSEYKNPLTPKQQQELKRFVKGGGKGYGLVVVKSTEAIGSFLCIFSPLGERASTKTCVPYLKGKGYNMPLLFELYKGEQ